MGRPLSGFTRPSARDEAPHRGGAFPSRWRGGRSRSSIALALDRARFVLLVEPPEAVDPAVHESLITALEWLTLQAGIAIAVGPTEGRPAYHRFVEVDPGAGLEPETTEPAEGRRIETVAPPGRPHPLSRTEQTIHAALAKEDWAEGAQWNERLTIGSFGTAIRVDLLFADASLIVEFDGDEHRGRRTYARDRRRDSELTVLGYAVHRFTNDEVVADLQGVIADIRRYLSVARQQRGGGKGGSEGLHGS